MPELDLGNVKGPQGKSAYQSALDAGYSGSAEAFNAALSEVPGHIANSDIHVTAAQKTAWAGSVRYDEAQSLSDAQKAQARGNINAAPGGFGLGGAAKMLTDADNVDNIRVSGWYTWNWDPSKQPAGLPKEAKYHVGLMRVDNADTNYNIAQTIYFPKSSNTVNAGDQCVIQRIGIIDGTWNPLEWVNPPMILGTEYRTTERYLGKPVYVKAVDCGEITDGKEIDTGISWALKVDVISTQSSYSNPLPRVPFRTTAESLNEDGTAFYVNLHTIIFVCGPSGAGGQAIAIIRYTKTTD